MMTFCSEPADLLLVFPDIREVFVSLFSMLLSMAIFGAARYSELADSITSTFNSELCIAAATPYVAVWH